MRSVRGPQPRRDTLSFANSNPVSSKQATTLGSVEMGEEVVESMIYAIFAPVDGISWSDSYRVGDGSEGTVRSPR
jgi:hypothetical protein